MINFFDCLKLLFFCCRQNAEIHYLLFTLIWLSSFVYLFAIAEKFLTSLNQLSNVDQMGQYLDKSNTYLCQEYQELLKQLLSAAYQECIAPFQEQLLFTTLFKSFFFFFSWWNITEMLLKFPWMEKDNHRTNWYWRLKMNENGLCNDWRE